MEQTQELIEGIQRGLLQWYDFRKGSTVLYIGREDEPIAEMLREKELEVTCVSPEAMQNGDYTNQAGHFAYIVCIEVLEKQSCPAVWLKVFRSLLQDDGIMLLGMNNRMGIRYFCGDRDPYTEECFDGIEGYRRVYSKKEDAFVGRAYDKAEIKSMLAEAEWEKVCFFSVFSDLHHPMLLYSEAVLPNEDLANRMIPVLNYPYTAFMNERMLYGDLIDNGMFHQMANAYLIECTGKGVLTDVEQVTCSMDRGRERAVFTVLRHSGIVEKRAAYPEGRERLKRLAEHGHDLKEHGISVVDGEIQNDVYIMPYVQGEMAQLYLKRLLKTDKEKFLQELDRFRDLILHSSEIVKEDSGDGEGAVLRRGYWDMVPLNCFHMGEDFLFFDQEYCEENYPANAIITRMITTLYSGNGELNSIIPINELFARYGLSDQIERWQQMEGEFLAKLLNEKPLLRYYSRHRINDDAVNSNRQRINCSESEYREIYIDIFKDTDDRKIIVFGSGNFAQKFLELYQKDYPVYAVIDNNEKQWGESISGVEICAPAILQQLRPDEYKVIICIKNHASVVRQLKRLGVENYSIYDANIGYEKKTVRHIQQIENENVKKKYRVGYISGVFDLFHVGHLNMFRRAKEQCDYLIVGVVTDEGVRKIKKVEPFVPFEERIELVRSCRYVDEAVEIPFKYNDTKEAYKLYHFDCQFSGSDYIDNPSWLNNKEFLERNGATMVFFPYTQSTSSSKIKELIQQKLI